MKTTSIYLEVSILYCKEQEKLPCKQKHGTSSVTSLRSGVRNCCFSGFLCHLNLCVDTIVLEEHVATNFSLGDQQWHHCENLKQYKEIKKQNINFVLVCSLYKVYKISTKLWGCVSVHPCFIRKTTEWFLTKLRFPSVHCNLYYIGNWNQT